MSTNELLTFSGALFLTVIIPSPGVLACVSRALASGFEMAIFLSLGIMLGDMFFIFMAINGLAVIAEYLGELFTFIKYFGALYLIWLGFKSWTSKIEIDSSKDKKITTRSSCFLSGLTITLGNPKAIVFYLSLLPTFLNIKTLTSMDIIIIFVVALSILATILTSYSLTANHVRLLFQDDNKIKYVKRAAGSIMISTGIIIFVKK